MFFVRLTNIYISYQNWLCWTSGYFLSNLLRERGGMMLIITIKDKIIPDRYLNYCKNFLLLLNFPHTRDIVSRPEWGGEGGHHGGRYWRGSVKAATRMSLQPGPVTFREMINILLLITAHSTHSPSKFHEERSCWRRWWNDKMMMRHKSNFIIS